MSQKSIFDLIEEDPGLNKALAGLPGSNSLPALPAGVHRLTKGAVIEYGELHDGSGTGGYMALYLATEYEAARQALHNSGEKQHRRFVYVNTTDLPCLIVEAERKMRIKGVTADLGIPKGEDGVLVAMAFTFSPMSRQLTHELEGVAEELKQKYRF
ncbi:hypothetical protein HYU17_05565 [Candidatus Woesearchaeota archaeon]|nr:hypothetical protein [Candidatus Woesearchaeota archaeon]